MNMTIKELRETCDDLYYQFVCRLSHVTGFETVDHGTMKIFQLISIYGFSHLIKGFENETL